MNFITVSIVSHGHSGLLPALLADLAACPEVEHVVVTHNIPEPDVGIVRPDWLTVLKNVHPKGFGANHNAAFQRVKTPFFAVLNPDIRLLGDPFPVLLSCIERNGAALTAPAVVDPEGGIEDSARRYPTFANLIAKALGIDDGRLQYRLGDEAMVVPWVAGMFMLFRSDDFADEGGFDEGYFLYYEDVDVCRRLSRTGQRVVLCPAVHVQHDARRASRHDRRHMLWHLSSMVRYFRKHLRHTLW